VADEIRLVDGGRFRKIVEDGDRLIVDVNLYEACVSDVDGPPILAPWRDARTRELTLAQRAILGA
jgi:hypothetical protein